jgi:hypothetical protein
MCFFAIKGWYLALKYKAISQNILLKIIQLLFEDIYL